MNLGIVFHAVEHCNLGCKNCGHFCGIAEPEFADIEENRKDLIRLSQLFNLVKVQVMGGEPLLHDRVTDFLKNVKEIAPRAKLLLLTNGLLLPKMSDDFWLKTKEYSATILMSAYPVPNIDNIIKCACDKARKFGVSFYFRKRVIFYKFLNPEGTNDMVSTFNNCVYKSCHTLKYGKISVCGTPFHMSHYNKKFNQNVPLDGPVDIHDPSMTAEKIIESFTKPMSACKYCKRLNATPWGRGSKEMSDWL